MVKMENIKRDGNYVTFDGYIDGNREDHFEMKVDLKDDDKTVCSIEQNHYTNKAKFKIFSLIIRSEQTGKNLPAEYTYIWH